MCFGPQSGTQLNSTLAGLQAEREVLLRSVRDQEAELNSLRQQAQLHHSSLEQERQRSNMELGNLHAQLQQQVCTVWATAQLLLMSAWLVTDVCLCWIRPVVKASWPRSCRRSSSVCCSVPWWRLRASYWTLWPNWTTPYTSAASAHLVIIHWLHLSIII